MTLPQLFSAVIGGLVGLASLRSFALHRTRRFKALFWMVIGGAMVAAGFRPQIIEWFGEDSTELRVRLLVVFLSLVVLSVTLEAIRVSRMQERYAFLWLATGVVLLLGAVFADLAPWVEAATGMNYVATVVVMTVAFLLLMLFHFSVALSRLQHKLAQVARALALTEERLRQIEQGRAPSRRGDGDPGEPPSEA